jgi:hypothetical protein
MIWQLILVLFSFRFPELSSLSCSKLSSYSILSVRLLPNDFLLLPNLSYNLLVFNINTSPFSSDFSVHFSSDSLCLFDLLCLLCLFSVLFPDLLCFFPDSYESNDDDSDDDDFDDDDDSEEKLLIFG